MFLAPSGTLIAKLRWSKPLFGAVLEAHDTHGVQLRWICLCHGGATGAALRMAAPKHLDRYRSNPWNTVLRQRDGIIKEWAVAELDSKEDPVNTEIAKGKEKKSFKGSRAALRREGRKTHSSRSTRPVIKSIQKTKHSSLEICWSWGDIVNRGGNKPPFVLSQKLSESYRVNQEIVFYMTKLEKKEDFVQKPRELVKEGLLYELKNN